MVTLRRWVFYTSSHGHNSDKMLGYSVTDVDKEAAQSLVLSLSGQQWDPCGQCQRPALVPETGVEGSVGCLVWVQGGRG